MVIIGLLASIVIPRFVGQSEQAKVANTKANLDALRKAIELYYSKYGTLIDTTLEDMVTEGYIANPDEYENFVLNNGVGSYPANSEVGVPIIYGDYYLLEALVKYKNLKLSDKR